MAAQISRVSFSDLEGGTPAAIAAVASAFGEHPECLGIILVDGVPGYPEMRRRLLPLATKFVELDEAVKEQYVHPGSRYNFGWSHGKEKFAGRFDTAKGSYYANPQYDVPTEDPAIVEKYPGVCTPNIWPREHLPELEPAFKDLGRLIVSVGEKVGRACDIYAAQTNPSYPANYLEQAIVQSRCTKARLLYYFPQGSEQFQDEASKKDQDSWCGWHFDNGSLTGLTSAMYLDEENKETSCPDPSAGLYIKNRGGELVKAVIPPECLAFQMGEASQVVSGGILRATSHCVRAAYGPRSSKVARSTFAVFMQPTWDFKMTIPRGTDPATIDVKGWTSPEQTFSEFCAIKFQEYY